MDFLEFLQNEEKYQRKVIFDEKKMQFKVENKSKFYCMTYGYVFENSWKEARTNYCIKEIFNEDGQKIWYILKDDYFTGYYFYLDNHAVVLKHKEMSEAEIEKIKERVTTDKKKEKKTNIIVITIVAVLVVAIAIPIITSLIINKNSCVNGVSELTSLFGKGEEIAANGTYYLQRSNSDTVDKKVYIKLENGKWSDNDGLEGEYHISDDKITFYVTAYGEDTLFSAGTIKSGVIDIEILGLHSRYVKQ